MYEAEQHPPRRFSMLTLLATVGLLGIACAYCEKWTHVYVGHGQHATHLITAKESEVAPRLHAWMLSNGFEPTSDVPVEVTGNDTFGHPYANFYVGSYLGSAPLYVSLNANWANGDGPDADKTSNVLIYSAIHFHGRLWDARRTKESQAAFMDAFHSWCQDFKPESPVNAFHTRGLTNLELTMIINSSGPRPASTCGSPRIPS